ncbi:MAG: LysR substrate-binding domain-containing protein [Chloroflexota bacterium]
MELDGIEIFVKVVQAGSFSGAAKKLGMPNSTVSAKVSALEKRLGVSLLQRTTRKLHVTQAGEKYFQRCILALEQLQAAETELTSAQQEPRGCLRLTAPVELGHSLLAALVRNFLGRHPKIEVDLIITNRVVDLIGEGIDVAIRAGKLADSRLIAKRFALGDFGLWASPAYIRKHGAPSHPKELAEHNILRFFLFKGNRLELTNGSENAQAAITGRVRADDFETLKAFALLGEGIAYMPAFLCAEETQGNRLQRILPKWHGPAVSFSFVYPAQRFVPLKVRAFIIAAEEMWKKDAF